MLSFISSDEICLVCFAKERRRVSVKLRTNAYANNKMINNFPIIATPTIIFKGATIKIRMPIRAILKYI